MNYKRLIKSLLTSPVCWRWGIRNHGRNCYIGRYSKIDCRRGKLILGNDVSIMKFNLAYCHQDAIISIGDGTEIGQFSRIASLHRVSIGKEVISGPNVFISDYNHNYEDVNSPIKTQGNTQDANRVQIDDGCWIGTNVVIVGNVHIGRGSVIGANSVVNKDVPDYSVAVGSPARIIKQYNKDSMKWEYVN